MKVFGFPATRSARVVWTLEEAGANYDYVHVNLLKGEARQATFLGVNPGGKVPAFSDGELTLTESGAICMYVADKFPAAKLAPTHATRERAMGFCLLNNVAVAAASALSSGAQRVAIVDWDVHHGNGTQDIFWSDPSVFFASIQQWPFWPGSGGPGEGNETTLNVPLEAGSDDDVYLCLLYTSDAADD